MAARKPRNGDHVVCGTADPVDGVYELGVCLRCGQKLRLGLPLEVRTVAAACLAFERAHRECPKTEGR